MQKKLQGKFKNMANPIGIVVRELSYLKVLGPVMHQLHEQGQEYILFHWDVPRGNKEYNRATVPKLKLADPQSVKWAKKVKAFTSDPQLIKQLVHDKVTKMVSLEVYLWGKSYLKELKRLGIKVYSILYLIDSLTTQKSPDCVTSIDRIYYTSKYLMEMQHKFIGVSYDPKRDRCLGAPAFDHLTDDVGKNILVLMPNLRQEHVKGAFGSTERFLKIIEKLSKADNLVFKTRTKQWVPKGIGKFAKELVSDGDIMNPPVLAKLLRESYFTVMFHSSGIFECIHGANRVLNIALPLNRWPWDKKILETYFSSQDGNIYQFGGVVNTISQDEVLNDAWSFKPSPIDFDCRARWLSKFLEIDNSNSAQRIVEDLVK